MKKEEFDNIIKLTDDKGNEVSFEYLDLVEYKDEEYVVLLPIDDEVDGEVVILKFEDGGNGCADNFIGIDSQETLDAVFDIFQKRVEEIVQEFEVIE